MFSGLLNLNRTSFYSFTSVLIDFEVRKMVAAKNTNFEIGTLVVSKAA